MKKSYIIIIIIALLTLGTLWAQQQGKNEDNATTTPPPASETAEQENISPEASPEPSDEQSENVVVFNGSAFTPDTMTVSQGETVTFRNESSGAVWPASDVHPHHTDLSGFDALKGLGQGEEYSFTFEEAGQWGYHDHLNPGFTGTIIVE